MLQRRGASCASSSAPPHSAPPRRGAPDETRRRLVAAAALLFNRAGFYGTDSNKIAKAAGCSAGVFSPTPRVRRFHRRQRKRQLEWMSQLRAQRKGSRRRREQDIVYLYCTEWMFDAIAQGELRSLGLNREFVIEAMVESAIEALS